MDAKARPDPATPSAASGEAGVIAQKDYLAALSHELRTPLNGVLGMAALLAGTKLAAEQRAYLQALQDCGEHLLGLVNNILDLSRLEAGELSLHSAPMEPRRLLQSTAELLSPRAHAKGLEIGWTAPGGAPAVLADEGRLRQILFNLAGNAVKFTEAGGVLLGVEVKPAGRGRARLRFTVADTGPGVPEAARERIFEAFAQASAEHGARADSTGLGLAIVRRLAQAMGGQAGVEPSAAGGSCFWFEADFPVESRARAHRPLAGRTVAVISPSPIVRQAASGLIEAAGGRALAAVEASAVAGRLPPDAAVLVDHAPSSGEARRKAGPRPLAGHPSIVLLAPEERARIPRFRAAGFSGYLIKPLRDVSLVERVLVAFDAARPAAAAPDERAAAQSAFGARVLLAEDNPINALLARSLLEREGCSVDIVASGEQALAAVGGVGYDLILMDVRMPGMDGRQAARALRAQGCRQPIIALTANAFEEDRQACLAAGMDDFLTKPLKPEVLQAMLRRWTAAGWTQAQTQAKFAS